MWIRTAAMVAVACVGFSIVAYADYYSYNGDWKGILLRDGGQLSGSGFYNYSGDWRQVYFTGNSGSANDSMNGQPKVIVTHGPVCPIVYMGVPYQVRTTVVMGNRGNSSYSFVRQGRRNSHYSFSRRHF